MKQILRLALGSVLAGSAVVSSAAVTNELLVKFKPNANPTIINATIGARTVRAYPQIGWQLVRLPAAVNIDRATRYYKGLTLIAGVTTGARFQLDQVATRTPNDPRYSEQGHHAVMSMPQTWAVTLGDPSTKIAILDSGVLTGHEDLAANIAPGGYDWSDGDNDPNPDPDPTNENGNYHGTHVAGCAAAIANNGVGVAGTGWNVKILPMKVFPNFTEANVGSAIMDAADKGARVINMSFGTYDPANFLADAVKYAIDKDVVVVATAGNNDTSTKRYPASNPDVVSVGATNLDDTKASFSNYGDHVKVAAPGVQILATFCDPNDLSKKNMYERLDGTSMAAPNIAGAIALMRGYSPNSSGEEIRQALFTTAKPLAAGFVRYGRVNIFSALQQLSRPVISELTPATARVATGEGTIVNPTGSPVTDTGYLAAADGSSLEVRSNYVNAVGTVAGLTTDFKISAAPSKIITSRLKLSVSASSGVTMLVMVQNPSTAKYEQITSTRLSSSVTSLDLPIIRSSLVRYIKADGSVRVMLRAINPSRLAPGGAPFRASFDSVGMSVTVSTR